ncbi:MAG TPA: glycosyltransferase family 4 protein [Bauldia sp.]|nr:glycosyltransferase family 4 protein [Bauldia sp.]
MPEDDRALAVYIASPLGREGRGGIDRLMDMVIGEIENRRDLGVEVTRITTRGDRNIALSPFYLALAMAHLSVARFRRRVDILHINLSNHGSTYRKLALAAWARALGVPYVLHLHSGRYEQFLDTSPASLVASIRTMFVRSAYVIVLGDYWARAVASRFPEVESKLVVLPNACPGGERLRRVDEAGPVQILFLGKLVKAKGISELIGALGKLRERSDWVATIAGDGDIETWRRQADSLGIGERVDFPGWLGPEEAWMRLGQADIFVLPSHVENLPVALVEAFGMGLPIVTTPVGAIPEVVRDGDNGILVPPGDVEALAGALRRLLDEPELRRRLGDQAQRDHQARHEMGRYLRRLADLWRQAGGFASGA